LRANASMHRQAEAFFLSVTANGAAQGWYSARAGVSAPISHYDTFPEAVGSLDPHGQWLSEHGLWKNRIKYGENAFHSNQVGIRYAQLEHFCRSNLQGGFTNGNRHDQDPARPPHGGRT
jgi:hypothetical protein